MRNMGLINWFFVLCILIVCLNLVSSCIDINSASAEELDELYGVGPVYAERIIEARPFDSVDDLIEVNGIGEITLEKIKQQGLACVGGEESSGEDSENVETQIDIDEDIVLVDEDKTEEIIEEDQNDVILLNENVINLNQQQETDKIIYESKNEKVKNYAIYFFPGFLILIIIILLIWR